MLNLNKDTCNESFFNQYDCLTRCIFPLISTCILRSATSPRDHQSISFKKYQHIQKKAFLSTRKLSCRSSQTAFFVLFCYSLCLAHPSRDITGCEDNLQEKENVANDFPFNCLLSFTFARKDYLLLTKDVIFTQINSSQINYWHGPRLAMCNIISAC